MLWPAGKLSSIFMEPRQHNLRSLNLLTTFDEPQAVLR
jgi:hypothetical protein